VTLATCRFVNDNQNVDLFPDGTSQANCDYDVVTQTWYPKYPRGKVGPRLEKCCFIKMTEVQFKVYGLGVRGSGLWFGV